MISHHHTYCLNLNANFKLQQCDEGGEVEENAVIAFMKMLYPIRKRLN